MKSKKNFKPKVLAVDDEAGVLSAIKKMIEHLGLPCKEAQDGEQALEMMAEEPFDIVILDMKMPGMDGIEVLKRIRKSHPETVAIMITGHPSIADAVESIQVGAMDYLEKPFEFNDLKDLVLRACEAIDKRVRQAATGEGRNSVRIVGKSTPIQEVIATIRRVACADSSVLITGESGTGKELAARAIHDHSARCGNDYVAVDCSSLVESLIESELFGHVKGAFTGAHENKHGLFELANHGTFFFDEITNLSVNTQAKLLRVIQEREFIKVGSRERRKLDIRIITASNDNLPEAIKRGVFRKDLYYRINVVPIHLPPLRQRSDDIVLLVEHFLGEYNREYNCNVQGISDEALEMLISYSWPGNVRELKHLIERIIVMGVDDLIRLEHLPRFIAQRSREFHVPSEDGHGYQSLENVEKRYIEFILGRTKGRRHQAARILGINRKTLAAKINKYGLRVNL